MPIIKEITEQLKDIRDRKNFSRSLLLKSRNSASTQSPQKLKQKHKSLEKAALELPSAIFSRLKVGNFSSTIRKPSAFTTANSSLARRQNQSIDSRNPESGRHNTMQHSYRAHSFNSPFKDQTTPVQLGNVLQKLKSERSVRGMTLKTSQSHANLGLKLKKIIKQISTLGIHAYPAKPKQPASRRNTTNNDEAF